jgi:DNA processing protein
MAAARSSLSRWRKHHPAAVEPKTMNVNDYLSDDGLAMLALCSAFGVKSGTPDAELEPFKLAEWNDLEKRIYNSSIKSPSALQNRSGDELVQQLSIVPGEAERIERLLGRLGRLALDLENLFSRGMWAVSRLDDIYPKRLCNMLKHQAPTILFGAGEARLLDTPGVAVVGSRNIDEPGAAFAREVGRRTAGSDLAVVSGGARGTDRIAMDGAIESEGKAIGVLADSLETTIRKSDVRELLLEGRVVLLTPYAPTAGFSIGGAMGRNKLIYGLAEFAVVVSSDFQTGGTWAGAVEALKGRWCPVFVRDGEGVPKGNRELAKMGAASFEQNELSKIEDLRGWLRQNAKPQASELDLFGAK